MSIYIIAEYKVRNSGVEKVKRAIAEFVPHIQAHEPGTKLYLAWSRSKIRHALCTSSFLRMRRRSRRIAGRTR